MKDEGHSYKLIVCMSIGKVSRRCKRMSYHTNRRLKLVGLAILFFLLTNVTLLRTVLQYKEDGMRRNHEIEGELPSILIWYPPFDSKNEYRADPDECGDGIHCKVTYNRSCHDRSDAVVFHFKSIRKETLPQKRRSDQLYVWWSGEKNHEGDLKEYDRYFNLTFTYRRDSGIYAPYGSTNIILDELRSAKEYDLETLLKRKRKSRKLAAWVVSNCSVHRRMKLAKDLIAAGLDLDTYGACFEHRKIGDGPNTESFYTALSEYKFYLAFENGYHCKDYITEKFWYNGLRAGAVPVVWGPKKTDLEAVAPKDSFIFVEDFENVDTLVEYLLRLSVNEIEYKKYLMWRTWISNPELSESRFRHQQGQLHSFCKLCNIILDRRKQPQESRDSLIVDSLHDWWWKEENQQCMQTNYFDMQIPQDGVKRFLKSRGIEFAL